MVFLVLHKSIYLVLRSDVLISYSTPERWSRPEMTADSKYCRACAHGYLPESGGNTPQVTSMMSGCLK